MNKRELPLYFLIDSSEEIIDIVMQTINVACEELIAELQDISESIADISIKIRVLSIGGMANWIDNDTYISNEFQWKYLVKYEDKINMTDAFIQLDRTLNTDFSKKDVLEKQIYRPIIFLLVRSQNIMDYNAGLNNLLNNDLFIKSKKVSIQIGEDKIGVRTKMLEEFTGNLSNIMSVYTPEAIKKWIDLEEIN